MFLALTVLLLHPPAVPATAIARLPLNSTVYSSVLLTTTPASASDDKSASDKNTDSKSAATASAIPDSAAVATVLSKPAVSPDPVAFVPGQLELTPMDADEAGSSSSRSSNSEFAAPSSFRSAERAGRAHVLPPKQWLILSAASHGAATFDAWSTRRVIMNGTGQELNPMLKPFANSNVLYAAVQVAPFAFDYLGLRMMRSSHPWVRKMWWAPQAASTAASFMAGAHNMSLH